MNKLTFSGHETFQCRHLWLKKGYDFLHDGGKFKDEDAVVKLGVGKNMVSSIRFWLKAFDLITTEDKLTPLALLLLDDKGWDPYLEDEGTLWLLHFHLIKNGLASSYSIMFNELRREKIEFTRENFISYVKRKGEDMGITNINEKTLAEDFSVLTKMYLYADSELKDKEDSFSGLLTELGLMKNYGKKGSEYFVIENNDRTEIPDAIILYGILNMEGIGVSINLNAIEQEKNSVGSIFAINRNGLVSKIESIAENFSGIVYNDNAGIKEIQFKKTYKPLKVLEKYYAN